MKMTIKQYDYKPIEVESKEIELPTEVSYYFEGGIRRSIKITPIFTTWNKERFNKDEELYSLDVICLYNSFECKLEKFNIYVKDIENIFYSDKHKHKEFVDALVLDWLDKRSEKDFEDDLNNILTQINK